MTAAERDKLRVAVISTTGNVLLTIFKFAAYFFTSSIVILAEAWHSFSDIITSLMVFLAVKKDIKTPAKPVAEQSLARRIASAPAEIKSSIIIGLFIISVGVSILFKVLFEAPRIVQYPLLTGILFLAFGVLSFLIYRFELSMGQKLSSPGLISDAMHSKSDAFTALLAGFTLILYQIGLNIEKPVAALISIIIVSFGTEVVYNSIRAIDEREHIFKASFTQIIFRIFRKDTWLRIDKALHISLFTRLLNPPWSSRLKYAGAGLVLLLYLLTCFYQVPVGSQGVIERLGTPVGRTPIGPGLHLKLPYPIERTVIVDTHRVKSLDIGNLIAENSFALLWTQEHGANEPYLSGDNNLFYPYITIYYQVANIFDYLYASADVQSTLDNLAHSATTQTFLKYSFYDVAIYKRKHMPEYIFDLVKQQARALNLGIEILDVTIKDVHPPMSIAKSYEDVIAAIQDKEMMINKSYALKNKMLPEARAQAIQTRQAAAAYQTEVQNLAQGKAENFLQRLKAYERYPDIVRLYLQIQVLSAMYQDKILYIIDHTLPAPDIWAGRPFFGDNQLQPRGATQDYQMTEEELQIMEGGL